MPNHLCKKPIMEFSSLELQELDFFFFFCNFSFLLWSAGKIYHRRILTASSNLHISCLVKMNFMTKGMNKKKRHHSGTATILNAVFDHCFLQNFKWISPKHFSTNKTNTRSWIFIPIQQMYKQIAAEFLLWWTCFAFTMLFDTLLVC